MYMQPPLISCIEGKTWPVGPEVFFVTGPQPDRTRASAFLSCEQTCQSLSLSLSGSKEQNESELAAVTKYTLILRLHLCYESKSVQIMGLLYLDHSILDVSRPSHEKDVLKQLREELKNQYSIV